jgi:nucleotide-binding universal stress UspA family protein
VVTRRIIVGFDGPTAANAATTGVTLARAAGWDAETLVQPADGARGYGLAQLAQAMDPDVVLVGIRGLSGVPIVMAVLGGVSGALVRHSPKPVLVVPPGNPSVGRT